MSHVVLINKLLSSCPSIDTIYLLIRNKKGKDVYTRVDDIFHDPVSAIWFTYVSRKAKNKGHFVKSLTIYNSNDENGYAIL